MSQICSYIPAIYTSLSVTLRPNFHSDAEQKMFKFNFQANLIALLIKLNCNKPFVFQTFLYLDLDCSLNCLVIFSGVQLCSTQTGISWEPWAGNSQFSLDTDLSDGWSVKCLQSR